MVRSASTCAASPGHVALSTTEDWLCRRRASMRARRGSNYAELCKLLTQWRRETETSWKPEGCSDASATTGAEGSGARLHPLLRQTSRLLPRFPRRRRSATIASRYPDPKQVKLDPIHSRLFLPKLGWLRYRNSRQILGSVKNVTVSLRCGKWFVSIQTERELQQPACHEVARWALIWAWSGLPRSRTAPSTLRSTASSGTRSGCARHSKR